tara:strand:- start:4905 stop:5804 length:900 start_codon:yes stop_codon:yes gene_type:complete
MNYNDGNLDIYESTYETYAYALLSNNKILYNIKHICNSNIDKEFAESALENADIIVISKDDNNGIRGFMCVKKNYKPFGTRQHNYLYISLICNANKSSMKLISSPVKASGKDMLQWLIAYGQSNGFIGIGLRALLDVIPYYYKFGWRFRYDCGGAEEKPYIAEKVRTLNTILRTLNSNEKEVEKAISGFKRYLPDLHSNQELQSLATVNALREEVEQDKELGKWWEEWAQIEEGTNKKYITDAKDGGWLMLYCFGNPNAGYSKKKTKKSKPKSINKPKSRNAKPKSRKPKSRKPKSKRR